MTDLEYEILDNLYFVTDFKRLLEETNLSESLLQKGLADLLAKGWIKCFRSVNEELATGEVNFQVDYKNYFYLATKAGLLAHNRL